MCPPTNDHCDGECGGYCGRGNQQQNVSEESSLMDVILGGGNSGHSTGLVKTLARSTGSTIIEMFGPQVIKLARKYPKLTALASLPIVFWFVSKYIISNVESVWKWLMSYALASVAIKQEDKIFHNNVRS